MEIAFVILDETMMGAKYMLAAAKIKACNGDVLEAVIFMLLKLLKREIYA